uniref:Uncharacterized protein n=1 Tax=Arcella intermedia TaxID=1963864 RepID=A0A6B2LPF2_9EUKA
MSTSTCSKKRSVPHIIWCLNISFHFNQNIYNFQVSIKRCSNQRCISFKVHLSLNPYFHIPRNFPILIRCFNISFALDQYFDYFHISLLTSTLKGSPAIFHFQIDKYLFIVIWIEEHVSHFLKETFFTSIIKLF